VVEVNLQGLSRLRQQQRQQPLRHRESAAAAAAGSELSVTGLSSLPLGRQHWQQHQQEEEDPRCHPEAVAVEVERQRLFFLFLCCRSTSTTASFRTTSQTFRRVPPSTLPWLARFILWHHNPLLLRGQQLF
jgi:hypothetical protein